MNQIYTIEPYLKGTSWVFNDEARGLQEEPFVSGIPKIIKYYVKSRKKFKLLFSKAQFPDWNLKLQRQRVEFGGAWYFDTETNLEGWLCPALLKYFDKAPVKLFCKIEFIR